MKMNRNCEECGELFQAEHKEINRGNCKYCSLSCAGKNQRKNAQIYTMQCICCNQPFQAKYRTAKYCSRSCKLKTYRENQKGTEQSIKTFYRMLADVPCEICGWKECARDLHHIIPVSKGGKNSISNLISLCPNHHRMVHQNLVSQDALFRALKLRLSLHPEITQEQDAQAGY